MFFMFGVLKFEVKIVVGGNLSICSLFFSNRFMMFI